MYVSFCGGKDSCMQRKYAKKSETTEKQMPNSVSRAGSVNKSLLQKAGVPRYLVRSNRQKIQRQPKAEQVQIKPTRDTIQRQSTGKKTPIKYLEVTNIIKKNTQEKLKARGYHRVKIISGVREMEIWRRSDGAEVWLIHPASSTAENVESKTDTGKPPKRIPPPENQSSGYGGVKSEAFKIELGPFSASYARLYNNGYIEIYPLRHSRFIHTLVPVPGTPGEYYVYKNYKLKSGGPLGLFKGPRIIEVDISKFD